MDYSLERFEGLPSAASSARMLQSSCFTGPGRSKVVSDTVASAPAYDDDPSDDFDDDDMHVRNARIKATEEEDGDDGETLNATLRSLLASIIAAK